MARAPARVRVTERLARVLQPGRPRTHHHALRETREAQGDLPERAGRTRRYERHAAVRAGVPPVVRQPRRARQRRGGGPFRVPESGRRAAHAHAGVHAAHRATRRRAARAGRGRLPRRGVGFRTRPRNFERRSRRVPGRRPRDDRPDAPGRRVHRRRHRGGEPPRFGVDGARARDPDGVPGDLRRARPRRKAGAKARLREFQPKKQTARFAHRGGYSDARARPPAARADRGSRGVSVRLGRAPAHAAPDELRRAQTVRRETLKKRLC